MTTQSQMTMQVQALIDGLKRGDASARNELLKYAQSRFQKLASRMLRRDFTRVARFVATDDVIQEALVRLCKALDQNTPHDVEMFHRLMALQLRRELLELARRHFGPRGIGTNYVSDPGQGAESGPARRLEPMAPESSDPSAIAEWTLLHELAGRIPNNLRQQDVFALRYYDGLPVKEVANVLNISEALVKLRWAEALAWLRNALGGKPLPGM